ncbi:MAG: Alpha/beta hydrolase [Caulobacteraceae bacterium]|nr:Alpha/beta hydrolase [Caulobacteraceae bacterium]
MTDVQFPTTPFADRFWTAPDGLALHARDYSAASGPARAPVICIHGLTRNARDFEDLAPRLAAGRQSGGARRVLAVDVRGRGGSAWDPDPSHYAPPVYAGDILALMDALAIARAVFIGTSMGGLITMVVSALRPAAVAAAVLNDVGPELAAEGLARIGGYVGGGPPITDWDAAAAYAERLNRTAFPAYGADDWRAFARRIFTEQDGRPALDYDPGISQAFKKPDPKPGEEPPPPPDLWPLFKGLAKAPLLTIRGGASDLLSPDIAGRMREAAPDMAYAEVADVGHAPMLDEPEALAAIDALLKAAP